MCAIRKILVAVDFSDYTAQTVQFAAALANDVKASLVLVNILSERDVKAVYSGLAHFDAAFCEKKVEEWLTERKEKLSELARSIEAPGRFVKEIVRIDTPYQGILRAIEDEDPDLLVMGTKGRGALLDTIVGSCARKLFRRSPIPVLSLRPEKIIMPHATASGHGDKEELSC
jgi:nucleotide-binding universal stress UspA family protein